MRNEISPKRIAQVLTLAVALEACGNGVPSATKTSDITPSPIPSSLDAGQTFKINAPSINPTETQKPLVLQTREAIVSTLGGNVKPDMISLGYQRDNNGEVIMENGQGKPDGTIQIEAFPLKPGVKFDSFRQEYVDAQGKSIYKQEDIYNFTATPEWINGLTLNADGAYLFARTGGNTPKGQEDSKNVSRFIGTKGATVNEPIEQAALILSIDCDPATAAFRDAINNFTWNKDAQKGTIRIEWYNPETQGLELLDGRTISALAKAGKDLSIVSEMPANYPLTPDQAAKATGGTTKASQWVLNTDNGTWTYEGFGLNNGIRFDSNSGVFKDAKGNVVTDPAKIFNYNSYDANKWPNKMKAANLPGTYTFLRDKDNGNSNQPNISRYGTNGAEAIASGQQTGFEQAAIIMPRLAGCTNAESATIAMQADANEAAKNATIQVLAYKDGAWQAVTAN